MKNILSLALAFVCFSCHTVMKVQNKVSTTTDSVGTKTLLQSEVKKKDTTGSTVTTTSITKASDSGYKKTVVVKEYYTDEFDFDSDPLPSKNVNDSAAKPKIFYRVVTTIEEGAITKNENQVNQSAQNSVVKNLDSTTHRENQRTDLIKQVKESHLDKTTASRFPFWLILIIVLIAALAFVWYKYKPF